MLHIVYTCRYNVKRTLKLPSISRKWRKWFQLDTIHRTRVVTAEYFTNVGVQFPKQIEKTYHSFTK